MRHIDIHKIADEAKFNGFHASLLLWCALIIICDGYDLAVAGIAVPSIMKDMGESVAAGPSSFAWPCSASLRRQPASRITRTCLAPCAS
jgi:hypothetical protein